MTRNRSWTRTDLASMAGRIIPIAARLSPDEAVKGAKRRSEPLTGDGGVR
jgi:hypothetical protein